uniref:Putative tyrosine/tryptophan monooxygenase n=1 Tax=Coptotermes formosanus TaxID=36987 RepID=R4UKK6_COPFO|nr:putative tyrosine/tryptophan monooxygenase [Coptotermes formosanus]
MDGGNYIKEGRDSAKSTCLIFSPKQEAVGALAKSLKLFEKHGVNLIHIESRPSARFPNQYGFMVECAPSGELGIAIETLREHSSYFNIISRNHKDNRGKLSKCNHTALRTRPWTHHLVNSASLWHYTFDRKASSSVITKQF